jgi:hypothetical protein
MPSPRAKPPSGRIGRFRACPLPTACSSKLLSPPLEGEASTRLPSLPRVATLHSVVAAAGLMVAIPNGAGPAVIEGRRHTCGTNCFPKRDDFDFNNTSLGGKLLGHTLPPFRWLPRLVLCCFGGTVLAGAAIGGRVLRARRRPPVVIIYTYVYL